MMTETQVTWLTQESHDRLKVELDQLIANRPVIAAEINERREEGDLKENGGYHAAREDQGQQEARIRQLQELLSAAKVGVAPTQSGVALPGSVSPCTTTATNPTRRRSSSRPAKKVHATAISRPTRPAHRSARPHRGQGRRDTRVRAAQRQDDEGDAGFRRAVPRLIPTYAQRGPAGFSGRASLRSHRVR